MYSGMLFDGTMVKNFSKSLVKIKGKVFFDRPLQFCYEKSNKEPIFKYLQEFLFDFNAYTLFFLGFFQTFFSANSSLKFILSFFQAKLLTSNGTKVISWKIDTIFKGKQTN